MIILQGITINELIEKIESVIEKKVELQIKKLTSEIIPNNKYLTRTEVSKLLKVTLQLYTIGLNYVLLNLTESVIEFCIKKER